MIYYWDNLFLKINYKLNGNPGDVLVSNGSGSPAWVPGFPRFIGYFPYELPGSQLYHSGSTIFSTNLSGLNPGKNLLIQIFMPVRGTIAGSWNYAFNATINNLSKPSQTIAICLITSDNNWITPGMNPTLTFYFPSDFNGTSEQSLAITTGSRDIAAATDSDYAPVSGWCTVYEIQ